MNSILGLSHVVFTVTRDPQEDGCSKLLEKYYDEGQYFEFDHAKYRSDLIRNDVNSISRLTFYKSTFGNMPAIELLHVRNFGKRKSENYGIIFPDAAQPDHQLEKLFFCEGNNYVEYYYDDILNSLVAVSTNFFEDGCGCWVMVKDFEQQRNFLSKISSAKILAETDDLFIVKCRVINKKLSTFNIVLLRDTSPDSLTYNDDLGLSTLGWFSRDLDNLEENAILGNYSDCFPINLNGNNFDARFLYNNKGLSHELLKV